MFSIGNLTFNSPLVLAPMAGISDLPYRLINRSLGCRFAFTEMISADSLMQKSVNTLRMFTVSPHDRPLGVQLMGNNVETLKKVLDVISEYAFDIVDFNAACPAKKVASKGKGAGLLRDPVNLQKILKAIVDNSNVPVTVKIRAGWDETSLNAVETGLRAQDAGVKGITIHGRTKMQGYRGSVDYEIIRRVKESLDIPVIASGDALTPDLIKKMFEETGCDGVAVARGALGNPWIFRETDALMKNGTLLPRPDVSEITGIMKKHLALITGYLGERIGVIHFRKFFKWYTKGMALKELKAKAFLATTGDELLGLIDEVEKIESVEA
ncbi:MAG: tRNA dihydrouridine synthase DusB [Nitrospirota bacterium]